MRQKLSTLLVTFPLLASPLMAAEYSGKISNLMLTNTGNVILGVTEDEENPIDCQQGDWSLQFSIDQVYTEKWLDFVMLARNTNQSIRIGYEANSDDICDVTYVAAMQGDGYGNGDIGNEDGLLVETGALGNIALIGSNGLTEASYQTSSHYGSDAVAAAFDGYSWSDKINSDAGDKIHRGLWLASLERDDTGSVPRPWIQIDFGTQAKVAGFRVVINEKAANLGRGVKDMVVQISNDGVNFVDNETFRLSMTSDQTGDLSSPAQARYFRFLIKSNYGDSKFVEIDELELYQR